MFALNLSRRGTENQRKAEDASVLNHKEILSLHWLSVQSVHAPHILSV
jgi:hypothetical protein